MGAYRCSELRGFSYQRRGTEHHDKRHIVDFSLRNIERETLIEIRAHRAHHSGCRFLAFDKLAAVVKQHSEDEFCHAN